MKDKLSAPEMDDYMNGNHPGSIKATEVGQPTETVTIGEKMTLSSHYHMDLLELERGGAVGNDLFELDRSWHNGAGQNSGSGGANYSFADGSVRFVKSTMILWPLNLWAVTEAGRTNYAVQ